MRAVRLSWKVPPFWGQADADIPESGAGNALGCRPSSARRSLGLEWGRNDDRFMTYCAFGGKSDHE